MKNILTTLTLTFLATGLFSQAHNEQVTVIAPFQPTVLDAHKINVIPQTIDSALVPREVRYSILSRKVMTSFGIDHIRPARVAGEPLPRLTPLYVRGGFGNYGTSYGELFYGSGRSAQWQYGAHLKHRSSRGTFENHLVPFDNSINLINLFGGYTGKNVLLSADFHYDRKRFSAYGGDAHFLWFDSIYTGGDFLKENRYKRIYQNIGGNIRFSDNNTEQEGFKYSGNFAINSFQPNYVKEWSLGNEWALEFDGNINQTFEGRRPIFNQTTVGFDVSANWYPLTSDYIGRTGAAHLFRFHPYGNIRFSGHDFSIGLRVNLFEGEPDFSTRKISTDFQIVPTVRARFNLIDNLFAIEFGLDGNAEVVTNRTIANKNPFMFRDMTGGLPVTQLHREYYLGLNTLLSKNIDFSMKGKFVSYKNLVNFDTDYFYGFMYWDWPWHWPWFPPTMTPFFGPTYQDVNCFQIQANLNYQLGDRISISTMAQYNLYDKDSRDFILYRPTFEANLTARYNIQDKIILRTQLYVDAGRNYREHSYSYGLLGLYLPEIKTFKPTIDWSLAAEYRLNRRWGAFMEFNNILNQRRMEWVGYRSFGMNFLLGATFNL